jgi:uncharacterized protein (TIGR02300 family)
LSKTEWGLKRRCSKCDAPFYDMRREPIRCPKCGTVFNPATAAQSAAAARRARARPIRPAWGSVSAMAAGRAEVVNDEPAEAPVPDNDDQSEDDGEIATEEETEDAGDASDGDDAENKPEG